MAQFNYQKQYGECPVCKKKILIYDKNRVTYCGQVCESEARFRGQRYVGLGSDKSGRSKRPIGVL